jgi:hypothetical protein
MTTTNRFGLLGDARNVLREVESKLNAAIHLIHCTEGALRDGKIGDGPDEIDPHRLANNLKDALETLREVSP